MKRILFPVLFSLFLQIDAQNPELTSTGWFLMKIEMNGETLLRPEGPIPTASHIDVSTNPNRFHSTYFNTAVTQLIFVNNSNTFTKTMSACTLSMYDGSGDNQQIQKFDNRNCNFFLMPVDGSVFQYQIINQGTYKSLIVTNVNGDKLYYSSQFLAAENSTVPKFKIYPNPTSDFLTIDNLDEISLIKLFDASGKSVYESINKGSKILEINIKHLPAGIYYMMINDAKPIQIIKK